MLLLDTHVFIWWREARHLSEAASALISEAETVHVSLVSAWEIAIKQAFGKLRLDADFRDGVRDSGFELLAIDYEHVQAVRTLPHHHRDPFDRLLVAQAMTEGLTLVTRDRVFSGYQVPILWA
ncbi:MAG: type II toxin-antitoxin system VapC family toxin [Azospirillaceae bacterium]